LITSSSSKWAYSQEWFFQTKWTIHRISTTWIWIKTWCTNLNKTTLASRVNNKKVNNIFKMVGWWEYSTWINNNQEHRTILYMRIYPTAFLQLYYRSKGKWIQVMDKLKILINLWRFTSWINLLKQNQRLKMLAIWCSKENIRSLFKNWLN
jgi:hypothetical protein